MTTIPHYNSIINNISQYFFEAHTITKNLLSENFITYTSKNISCDAYARYLEKLDYKFMISLERKKYYIVKDIKSRCIETEFGTVTFKRRYYLHKQTKQYYFYLDSEILSLKPYQRLSNELISNILSSVTVDSYQRIADTYNLSKTTIYNIVCSLAGKVFDFEYNDNPTSTPILYIQADECYSSLQKAKKNKKTNKMVVEQVVIHEGLEAVNKTRNKLVNKIMITRGYGESMHEFNSRVSNIIKNLYNYDKLYFYGDGANWITGCADKVGAIFILDLFHSYQAISRITGANKEHIDKLIKLCKEDRLDDFIDYVTVNLDPKSFNKYKKNNYKYIKSNWSKIQRNYKLERSVGCSQEGINFHYFAKRITTIPRGFSEKNVRTIAQLICAKNNDKNFQHTMLKYLEDENKNNIRNENNTELINNEYLIKQSYIAGTSCFKNLLKNSGVIS